MSSSWSQHPQVRSRWGRWWQSSWRILIDRPFGGWNRKLLPPLNPSSYVPLSANSSVRYTTNLLAEQTEMVMEWTRFHAHHNPMIWFISLVDYHVVQGRPVDGGNSVINSLSEWENKVFLEATWTSLGRWKGVGTEGNHLHSAPLSSTLLEKRNGYELLKRPLLWAGGKTAIY